jgi:hypothetical protein
LPPGLRLLLSMGGKEFATIGHLAGLLSEFWRAVESEAVPHASPRICNLVSPVQADRRSTVEFLEPEADQPLAQQLFHELSSTIRRALPDSRIEHVLAL